MEGVGMHPKVYEAAKSGDFENLMTIISGNGEDLFHQKTPKGNNILHVAALHKHVSLIQHLLRCPSRLSLLWQVNCKGDTPLHVAAKVGSCEAVRVLADLVKSLPLDAGNGQVDPWKELLRKQNLHEDTALHHAIRGGHDLVVELMIEEDPQLLDMTNAADESPLYLAADRRLSRATELILGAFSSSSSHKGPKGLTALHVGISLSPTIWEKIMEKRPELVREGDDIGWTPLHVVAYRGKVEAVRLLLQHNTSVAYDLDKAGQSALHLATFQGHADVIDELVRSCPDACEILNTKGQTALHTAVIGGQVNVVRYMLGMPKQDDLINVQDNDGNTALHLAALLKQSIIICILARDKRVDLLAKNKDHLTAFDIFLDHNEMGSTASDVRYLLKGSHGLPGFQGRFVEHDKKRLDLQFVQGQPSVSITTGSAIANQENFNLSEKSIVDVQLLVAALVASLTFPAIFTVPGVLKDDQPNQGMAINADKAASKDLVAWNSAAFVCSIVAILIHVCRLTFSGRQGQKDDVRFVGAFVLFGTMAILITYATGMDGLLNNPSETIGEKFLGCFASGYLFVIACAFLFRDHKALSWLRDSSPVRWNRKFYIECAMRLHYFDAWLGYGRQCWRLENYLEWGVNRL